VGVGLLAAVLSGVIAYRIVGPYGDGPLSVGFRRIPDPETGEMVLVRDFERDGVPMRAVVDDRRRRVSEIRLDADDDGVEDARVYLDPGADRDEAVVVRVEQDVDGDGDIDRWDYYDERQALEKVGFSLTGDGVVNAWAFYTADGQLDRIEVSTKSDDTIDRWEYYENGRMVRLEVDTNGDGRVDATYVNGVPSSTAAGEDGAGQPDRPEPEGVGNP